MKDSFGTEIEVGDIVLSAATREHGYFRIGKVTKLYKDGSPAIKSPSKKFEWDGVSERGAYVPAWYNGKAGTNLLVLSKDDGYRIPEALAQRLLMDYEADAPDLG